MFASITEIRILLILRHSKHHIQIINKQPGLRPIYTILEYRTKKGIRLKDSIQHTWYNRRNQRKQTAIHPLFETKKP